MNEHLRPGGLPGTTQAAEGLPRRRWSVAEIEAMVAKGIIAEDERFELIGGEVVPMCPKGRQHEILRSELAFYMTQRAGADVRVVAEAQLNLTDDAYLLPDILVHPASPDNAPGRRDRAQQSRIRPADQGPALCQLRRARVLGHQCQDARDDRAPPAVGLGVLAERTPDRARSAGPRGGARLAVTLRDLDLG